jgi:hypothetical protein
MADTTTDTTPAIKPSSAFTRVVGNIRLDVINARQNPDSVPKSVKSKWAVLEVNGKKTKVISQGDKKYPQIDSLRAHEIVLKAAQANKD